jgi:hypothetical protein
MNMDTLICLVRRYRKNKINQSVENELILEAFFDYKS